MSKRTLGILLILAGAAIASWVLGPGRVRRGTSSGNLPVGPRSVLLVTLDTTRADRLGPYGATDIETPTLSALAESGALFEQAFSVAPITLVAHASMLSGRYPFEHGVRNNGLHRLDGGEETLAERLADAGYRTAAFVSAAVLERRYGLDQGFEVYDDDLSAGRVRRPRSVADRPAEAVVDAAARWLDALPEDDRFFAWVHFYDPHHPYVPPSPYRERYRDRPYAGEIAYMDSQLGRLLAHPRIGEQTIVVVVGDHGESLGEHEERSHALLAYDATLRIPWLLRVPGGPRGSRIDAPVSQVDLMPTLLGLLGERPAKAAAGQSLLPLLGGGPRPQDRALYSETFLPYYTYGWAKLRVVRQGPSKLIDAPAPELYDLDLDPHELTNILEQQPGAAADRRRDLDELLVASGGSDRETALALDIGALEKLRSLGYLAAGSGPQTAPGAGERPVPMAMIGLHLDLERARTLGDNGLYDLAVEAVDRVLEQDPDNLGALVDRADYLGASGRLGEAATAIGRCLELQPDYPPLHVRLAAIEARQGKPGRALELLDVALDLEPRYLEAIRLRARLLGRMGRRDEAIAALRTALADYPDDPGLNVHFAEAVEIPAGQAALAEERLTRSLARDPFDAEVRRLLGALYERSGRAEEALTLYQDGIARDPQEPHFHARAGVLLAARGGEGAEHHLREASRLSTGSRPDVSLALGVWLSDRGRADEARAEFERVLASAARADANSRALAHYHLGNLEAAERELAGLLDAEPDRVEALINLAAVAARNGDWSRAETFSRRALAIDEGLAEAWTNLGISLDEQGRRQEARAALERALDADPSYWPARNSLAVSLLADGEIERARGLFEQVLEQVPDQAEVHWELGWLYADSLRDPERAAAHLERFVRLAPQDPRAEEALSRLAALRQAG